MKIKILVLDVDGTLTDGKIYVAVGGEFCKAFNIKDGCGIHDILIPSGIVPIVITSRESAIVFSRCAEIGISQIYQGVHDKEAKLDKVLAEAGCSYENVAYIGDDINDLPCMRRVKAAGGLVGCPADAVPEVTVLSDFVSSKNGGEGAVREFIECIMKIL